MILSNVILDASSLESPNLVINHLNNLEGSGLSEIQHIAIIPEILTVEIQNIFLTPVYDNLEIDPQIQIIEIKPKLTKNPISPENGNITIS